MKHFTSYLMLCTISTAFFASCGSNQSKTESSTTDTTKTTTTNVTQPSASASTIDTMPQNMLVIRQRVANFSKWKPVFESRDSIRLANGIHKYVIGRGVQDSNMIMTAMKIDDVAKAKTYTKDPGLRQAMQKGGIIGSPTFMLQKVVYQDTATLDPNTIRAMNIFTVKDWNNWRNAFENNRSLRKDNGIADRVYGYDVDDNHKVTLVVALTDTAKAGMFYRSDRFKQNREKAGVVGQPQQFLYRIVQRY